uniref:eCIS core domain-containing protein n=1 Tax=Algoriphagus sp. TaxID=1872435 RepID=UPI0040479363
MGIHAQKKQEEKSQSQSKEIAQLKNEGSEANDFLDLRPEAETPKKMQQLADRSFRSSKLSSLQSLADSNVKTSMPIQGKFQTIQKSGLEDEELLQGKFQTIQKVEEEEELIQGKFISPPKEENTTGLPDALKSGVESLSGVSLNDVKVYRNSDKPAQLQAHAYAQGTDIHLGPGQDQHLPHEAWHVVQQKQGRVKPTVKVNGDVPVNDSPSLEEEATNMGQKALNLNTQNSRKTPNNVSIQRPTAQLWGWPTWGGTKKKAEEYYEEEKGYKVENGEEIENKRKGPEFLKGSIGGALGVAGGLVGGTLGGLWGLGKSLTGNRDEVTNDKGEKVKKGFFEQIGSSAIKGGTAGRDMGRVAGAGIIDGTKAVAGGAAGLALGAAGGVVGALGGAIYGGVKGAAGHGDRKFTGAMGETNENVKRKGILEQMWESGKEGAGFGAKGGKALGKGVVDLGFGLADETGDFAINASRGALGAAGGVVGGLGGAVYGGVKGAAGHGDRKFTGAMGETNNNVKRRGALEQMWESGKEGANYGFGKGANSKLTEKVIKSGAGMAGTALGALAGPAGAVAGGFIASSGVESYYGGSRKSAELAGTLSAVSGGVKDFLPNAADLLKTGTAANVATAGGVTAGQTGASETLKAVGNGIIDATKLAPAVADPAAPSVNDERGFGQKVMDGARSLPGIAKKGIADLGNDVEEPYTLGTKASEQMERIKGLFGFGKK